MARRKRMTNYIPSPKLPGDWNDYTHEMKKIPDGPAKQVVARHVETLRREFVAQSVALQQVQQALDDVPNDDGAFRAYVRNVVEAALTKL